MKKKNTVVIPTAGLGSRMGNLSKELNKSLIPYKWKPVLAHIIEQFPHDTRFIIPTGYKSQQVKDFCNLVYNDRQIEFVDIEDFTSKTSGPGYTMSRCLDIINEPFWYIPCDTYFEEDLTKYELNEDTTFVKKVPSELTSLYTMFDVKDSRVNQMTFKEYTSDTWLALTGVMYIYDWQGFSNRLKSLASPEIIWTIQKGSLVIELPSWLDFGNLKIYQDALKDSQDYDFTKPDELTYICNNKVAKWWANVKTAEQKFQRTLGNPDVFPNNCKNQGSWLVYDYFPGTPVYENYSVDILKNMLAWLDSKVWIQKNINIEKEARNFYQIKTIDRINQFLEKYPNIEDAIAIDGVKVKTWKYYYENINWDLLIKETLPGFVHGDLHFDNTVINNEYEFKIIDWRHDFAGRTDVGDIYYDLGKLCGGFIINYSKIKQNEFTFENNNGEVTLSIPSVNDNETYLSTVKDFVISKNWNYQKVQLLIPIIFWNMAPLHTPLFDKFLWYLGIKLFENFENDIK